jgi:hypothetical protein
MKTLYLLAAILGTLVPYFFFVPFLMKHGIDIPLFVDQLFANRISAFFWDGPNRLIRGTMDFCFRRRQPSSHETSVGVCDLQSDGWCFIGPAAVFVLSSKNARAKLVS